MEKKQVIVFAGKAFRFLIFFLILDFLLGSIAEFIFFKQSTGKYARITYSMEKTNQDILIFGSSHANRHYVPSVFEKKMNLSCYNTGVQGQEILFHSVLQEIILARKKPKIIILNIDQNWLFESPHAYERLSDLHPYYSKYQFYIKPLIKIKSKSAQVFLNLKSYRQNSTIVHILKYFIAPQITLNGYNPLYEKMEVPLITNSDISIQKPAKIKKTIDSNFACALQNFIKIAKRNDITLFCTISPTLMGVEIENESISLIKQILKNDAIPLINFTNHPKFKGNYELFYDDTHLNNEGAILFSAFLTDSIVHRLMPNKF